MGIWIDTADYYGRRPGMKHLAETVEQAEKDKVKNAHRSTGSGAKQSAEAGEEDADWITLRVGIDPATARGVVKFANLNYIYYNPSTQSWF